MKYAFVTLALLSFGSLTACEPGAGGVAVTAPSGGGGDGDGGGC
jgi:hypothetical protein